MMIRDNLYLGVAAVALTLSLGGAHAPAKAQDRLFRSDRATSMSELGPTEILGLEVTAASGTSVRSYRPDPSAVALRNRAGRQGYARNCLRPPA